jgi:hypothetical protein
VASFGVVVLWLVPLALSMAAYAGISRLAPALARAARRPRRHPQHRKPLSRAA